MSYEMLQNIYITAGVASLVMAVVSAALFFLLRIPDVYGYLTGKTRKKGIAEIREQGGSGGRQKPAAKKPGKKPAAKKAAKAEAAPYGKRITAEMPPAPVAAATVPLEQGNPTTVLESAANLTTVLPENASVATTLLPENMTAAYQPEVTAQPFEIEFEITYIHTNEVIA